MKWTKLACDTQPQLIKVYPSTSWTTRWTRTQRSWSSGDLIHKKSVREEEKKRKVTKNFGEENQDLKIMGLGKNIKFFLELYTHLKPNQQYLYRNIIFLISNLNFFEKLHWTIFAVSRKNILTVCKQAIDEREKKGKESQVIKSKSNQLINHGFIHSCIHAFIHAFIHSCIYSFMHLFIHAFIHSCIH